MLNLESLSITSVFNSIVNFFRSNENNTKWRDISRGSEASFLIRLLSNVFSAVSYRVVAQSRENFLSTAALPSSNIGLSIMDGYSVFRGRNLRRKIKILANGDYVFPKFSTIGNYNGEYTIVTANDVSLENGEVAEIEVIVGNVKEQTITTGTSAVKIFSLFTTGISEDFSLFLDSKEVPVTNVIRDLYNDKYLVRTNPYGSVDVSYLNTFGTAKYKYGTGTEITIRYVELANVPVYVIHFFGLDLVKPSISFHVLFLKKPSILVISDKSKPFKLMELADTLDSPPNMRTTEVIFLLFKKLNSKFLKLIPCNIP
jgi:hypothetical protein